MNDAERLNALRTYTGLTWRKLAEIAGLKTVQTFVDIRNGRHGISKAVAASVCEAFPEISLLWLRDGVGEMLLADRVEGDGVDQRISTLFPGADRLERNNSDAMREYPVGSLLVLKKVDKPLPGSNCFIETEDTTTIRKVQSNPTNDTYTLYATNTSIFPNGRLVYEPYTINVGIIKGIYAVVGYIVQS